MIRRLYFVLLIAISMGIQPAFARPQHESPGEWEIPHNIRNNEYLLESQRLVRLAEEAYLNADYDTSIELANEAIYYAQLSDEFVALQFKIMAANDGITVSEGPASLPASYTVQSWTDFKDCFWNIAGRPWVYGDPHRWRTLYNANRSRLPEPDNPNLLEPGIVLDIPNIQGEVRQGSWDSNRTYSPLN